MKLIFVRHGQTDWNKVKKRMGRADIELNDEGRAQCLEVVKGIPREFDALYASPLKRALQTAKAVSAHFQKPIEIRQEITERDFGSLSGMSWGEIEEKTGIDMRTITKREEYDFRPYGGESAEDVKARLLSFLEYLKTTGHSTVVIVCHSGVISMMHHLFPQEETPHITNTSIHEFIHQ